MSDKKAPSEVLQQNDLAWYKQEPWLPVCLSCFVPVFAAIYAPVSLKTPLIVIGGTLLVISMAMLIHKLRAK